MLQYNYDILNKRTNFLNNAGLLYTLLRLGGDTLVDRDCGDRVFTPRLFIYN